MPTKKLRSMKTNKAHATTLHSRIVRHRINACQAHTTGTLPSPCNASDKQSEYQCAHMLSRRFTATRTNLNNAWCLCARHHYVIDGNPDLWMALALNTVGSQHMRDLRALVEKGTHVEGKKVSHTIFWRHEVDRLAGIAVTEHVDTAGIPHDIVAPHLTTTGEHLAAA